MPRRASTDNAAAAPPMLLDLPQTVPGTLRRPAGRDPLFPASGPSAVIEDEENDFDGYDDDDEDDDLDDEDEDDEFDDDDELDDDEEDEFEDDDDLDDEDDDDFEDDDLDDD